MPLWWQPENKPVDAKRSPEESKKVLKKLKEDVYGKEKGTEGSGKKGKK